MGKPLIKGKSLAVEFVIDLIANGWTQSEMLQNYPRLTHEEIQACLCCASSLMKWLLSSLNIYSAILCQDA
jgi:uncharacterized protein (DUF433 family)